MPLTEEQMAWHIKRLREANKNKDEAVADRIAASLPVIEDNQVMALSFTRNPKLKKREE